MILKNKSRGFILIELLVVIAIIGLLASIILVALNISRGKGNDAAAEAEMEQIKNQTEIYYNTTGINSYGLITKVPVTTLSCVNAPTGYPGIQTMFHTTLSSGGLWDILAAVGADEPNSSGASGIATNVMCAAELPSSSTASSTSWAVSTTLSSQSGKYFCVDSSGYSGVGAKQAGGGGVGTAASCQ